jgi:uncharacterized protein (TIGR02391 family)
MTELTHEQRRVTDLIYEPFGARAEWPQQREIQRRLYREGSRKLDVSEVVASLPRGLVRTDGTVGGKISLTLLGLKETYHAAELSDFMTFLRLALERYGTEQEPRVGGYDLVQKLGFDELRLRKLALLLEQEFFLTNGTNYAPSGAPHEWPINSEIWRYDGCYSIEQYLEEREKQLGDLRRAPIPPPIGLGSIDPSAELHTADQPASAPVANAASFVQDPVLRARCAVLLADDAHFDRAIREAAVVLEARVREAIGGGSATGVPLMELAFSPEAPRLRLSTDKKEQLGAMQLYRGTMAFFRNPVGHQLNPAFTRDDAARFVAMVDLLLALLAKAERL